MAKKACKNCGLLVEGSECPLCHSKNLTDSWKGRIYIVDPEKSEIAKKLGLKAKGEYAIKLR